MKKAALMLLVLSLAFGSLVGPAMAKKKKKPPKPKPVPVTLYLHGDMPSGELEIADSISSGTYMTMDTTEGASQKSFPLLNYVGGPNSNCAGNSLFPVWIGDVSGTIVGEVKVTVGTLSTPGDLQVRMWPDTVAQACNDAYPVPGAEGTAPAPAGTGVAEATMTAGNLAPTFKLMLQVNAAIGGTVQGRLLYDTADSKVEFMCIPPAGKSSCTG